jgi:hypothetical protein
MSDRMFRLKQNTGRFTSYPLPTKGTYLRDIVFTSDGRACGSSNPLPAFPDFLEGGVEFVMCVDPTGAAARIQH